VAPSILPKDGGGNCPLARPPFIEAPGQNSFGFNPLECYKITKLQKYHKLLFNLPLPQPDPIPDTKGYIIQKINKK
jgi:hypothetical protein